MRMLLFLLQKEFLQVLRNKLFLRLLLVLPVVQLLVLVHAATMDMKNLQIVVCDLDHSPLSRRLTATLDASPFFDLLDPPPTVDEGKGALETGAADLLLVVPANFERSMQRGQVQALQLMADAINAQQAQLGYVYLQKTTAQLLSDVRFETSGRAWNPAVEVTSSFWYNPELNYKYFMFPGILVILVSVVGMFLTAMNLVREKEMGTIEQMNVSPVPKPVFIVAKLLPFWFIGLMELALGLLIGRLVYGVPMVGSPLLVFGLAAVYLVALLALGLLLSSFSTSQQQVTFVSYFFLLVFILMSGIFTSAENMPEWGQRLNVINPIFYFMDIMRSILLKGAGLADLWRQAASLAALAVVLMVLAVRTYRKTV